MNRSMKAMALGEKANEEPTLSIFLFLPPCSMCANTQTSSNVRSWPGIIRCCCRTRFPCGSGSPPSNCEAAQRGTKPLKPLLLWKSWNRSYRQPKVWRPFKPFKLSAYSSADVASVFFLRLVYSNTHWLMCDYVFYWIDGWVNICANIYEYI